MMDEWSVVVAVVDARDSLENANPLKSSHIVRSIRQCLVDGCNRNLMGQTLYGNQASMIEGRGGGYKTAKHHEETTLTHHCVFICRCSISRLTNVHEPMSLMFGFSFSKYRSANSTRSRPNPCPRRASGTSYNSCGDAMDTGGRIPCDKSPPYNDPLSRIIIRSGYHRRVSSQSVCALHHAGGRGPLASSESMNHESRGIRCQRATGGRMLRQPRGPVPTVFSNYIG